MRATGARGGGNTLHTIRTIWLVVVVLEYSFFLDALFLTWRQKYKYHRPHARLVLISLELNLVILWAMSKFLMGWEARLVPMPAEIALAIAGLLVTIAGAVLTDWGKLRLGKWFSVTFAVKEGHVLFTDGPFAITRHPIYTGAIITMIGSALVWNSLLTLALAALFAGALFFHTVYEESLFEHHFGEPYLRYQARVPRLVPFTRRRSPD